MIKLLPPQPRRQRKPRISTSGNKEPDTSTGTGSEERFEMIKELLQKVLEEAKQLPGVTTSVEHQCTEQEVSLDGKFKDSVLQQTISLLESFEQLREF